MFIECSCETANRSSINTDETPDVSHVTLKAGGRTWTNMLSAWYGTQYTENQHRRRELQKINLLHKQLTVNSVTGHRPTRGPSLRCGIGTWDSVAQLSPFTISLLVDRADIERYRYRLVTDRHGSALQTTADTDRASTITSEPGAQSQRSKQDAPDGELPRSVNVVELNGNNVDQTRQDGVSDVIAGHGQSVGQTFLNPSVVSLVTRSRTTSNVRGIRYSRPSYIRRISSEPLVTSYGDDATRDGTDVTARPEQQPKPGNVSGRDVTQPGQSPRDSESAQKYSRTVNEERTFQGVPLRHNTPQDVAAVEAAFVDVEFNCGNKHPLESSMLTKKCSLNQLGSQPSRDTTSNSGMNTCRAYNRTGTRKMLNQLYVDPMFDSSAEFLQRIGEISMLELDTIRCERAPVLRRAKKKTFTQFTVGSGVTWS